MTAVTVLQRRKLKLSAVEQYIQKNPWGFVISRRAFWIKDGFVFYTVLVIAYWPLGHWKWVMCGDALDTTSVIHNACLNKPGFAVEIIVPFIDTQFAEI